MSQGRKLEALKWTAEKACSEFGINPRTFSKRAKAIAVEPAYGKHYSSQQIAAILFGDMDGERLRETRAKADGLELDNASKRRELVPVAEFVRLYHNVLIAMRQRIQNEKGVREELKHDLLADLARLQTVAFKEAADPPAKKGKAPDPVEPPAP